MGKQVVQVQLNLPCSISTDKEMTRPLEGTGTDTATASQTLLHTTYSQGMTTTVTQEELPKRTRTSSAPGLQGRHQTGHHNTTTAGGTHSQTPRHVQPHNVPTPSLHQEGGATHDAVKSHQIN